MAGNSFLPEATKSHAEIVTNTHSHYDHTPGNDFLLRETAAHFIHPADFQDNQQMIIDGGSQSGCISPRVILAIPCVFTPESF